MLDRLEQEAVHLGHHEIEHDHRVAVLGEQLELRKMVSDAFASYQHSYLPAPANAALDAVQAELTSLYDEVRQRLHDRERAPDDAALAVAYSESLARLRAAQERDAEVASLAFREHIGWQQGAGYSAIEAARRVLDRDKNPA